MEKAYKNTGFLFLALFIIVLWGFSLTYIRRYTGLNGMNHAMQFHGILLFLWYLVLIIQPFLIKYNKRGLHRAIGKSVYVIAPLIIISIFLASKEKFHRLSSLVSREENIGQQVLNLASIFYFGLLFFLSVYYKKNTAYHIRFMVSSALLLFGPGIGRVFEIVGGYPFSESVVISVLITEVITVFLILYDLKNGGNYKPYLLSLGLLILFHLVWALRYGAAWQLVGGKLADWVF